MRRERFLNACAAAIIGFALGGAAGGARAAEEFDIPTVLPLTGNAAFLGQGEQKALEIEEGLVNQTGGLNGAPLRFVFHDDQSSPQTAVQLTSRILDQHPNVILGSTLVAMCNAMAPLVRHGPVMYCLSPGIHPAAGSFVFTGFISTRDLAQALVRYFRSEGFTKIAMITSTDASGQDGAEGFHEAMKLPENKNLKMVAEVQFAPNDVSVTAQIERVKESGAQALIVWTSGSPFGTVLRGIEEVGLKIPVGTTDANMTLAQMHQYASFLPDDILFMSSEWPPHGSDLKLAKGVEQAQAQMFDAFKAAKTPMDIDAPIAWDPGMLEITALRTLGTKASPDQIRRFIVSQKNWAGVDGMYDFSKTPQRGLSVEDSIVARWDKVKDSWTIVSKPGGEALQ
jgi:branched-chain amino acid transport system substrate-binding protein